MKAGWPQFFDGMVSVDVIRLGAVDMTRFCVLACLVLVTACGSGSNGDGDSGSEGEFLPANVILVDASATGADTGLSWADAFVDLQAALAATTVDRDEIWVAAGVYKPTSTTDRSASFQLLSEVSVYGGFSGGEVDRAERDTNANLSILSGEIGSPGFTPDNSYRVVVGATDAVLDGFTIRDGYANESGDLNGGGGIYCSGVSLSIVNCVIEDNYSLNHGAGAWIGDASNVVVVDCIFVSNTSVRHGGGLHVGYATAEVTNCVFRGNETTNASGGALAVLDASVAVTNTLFASNSAPVGGAAAISKSAPAFTNCTFSNNNATTDFGIGATFDIADNSAPSLKNCIVWGNTIVDDPVTGESEEYYSDGTSSLTATFTLTEFAFSGEGNITGDPFFSAPGSAYTLLNASPAIDMGSNSGVPTTDLAGNPRVIDGPNEAVTSAVVDMGCYENQNMGSLKTVLGTSN